jgi:hypothetical protein
VVAKDIYVDHSGANASRPQLDTVLGILRDGDTLKITRGSAPVAASRSSEVAVIRDSLYV